MCVFGIGMIKGTVVLNICFKLFTRLHVDLYLHAVVFLCTENGK